MAYTKMDQIYDAMLERGPMTTERIAEVTGINIRTVRHTLSTMHGGGEVCGERDPAYGQRYIWRATNRPSRYGSGAASASGNPGVDAVVAKAARIARGDLPVSYRPRVDSRDLGLSRRIQPMAGPRVGLVDRLLSIFNRPLEVD